MILCLCVVLCIGCLCLLLCVIMRVVECCWVKNCADLVLGVFVIEMR